ncbi:HAMP domain-containing methyl-accepting chemotaxis protein [Rhizobium sp. RU36D]|uniref:methyl-accepting chemotaxis protein n=1 Tax=Rhizobium sp. RU36D TaxID=1907415 RepID=UPI0009D909BE|nr:HAMP domain-containing methyl-accepting chemotaxis protein [Rhizobium sp. RU36D]SMC68452.1 methyl-accepting chemotaxis protein [Rhizobium sp. RU36D]
MKISISQSITLFGCVVGAGIFLAVGSNQYTLRELQVNGPAYQQIVYGKDLIADILPPPLFVIEAYLLATEGAYHSELAQPNLEKIRALKASYDQRRDFWDASNLAPALRGSLKKNAIETADRLWVMIETQYAGAVQSSDPDVKMAALDSMMDAYRAHRDAVTVLVNEANTFLANAEQDTATKSERLTLISGALAGLLGIILVGGLLVLRRRAVTPLNAMKAYMSNLARGDYSKPVPYVDRSDEIGQMASSVQVFRSAAMERKAIRERQEAAQTLTIERERAEMEARAAEDQQRARVIDSISKGLERLAAGDLTAEIADPFAPDYEKLRVEFNSSIRSLAQTMAEISGTVGSVRSGTDNIASGTDDLAKRTETQAAMLEEAASALDEITATVRTSAERAREANAMMTRTKESAEVSAAVVRDAVMAMAKIQESSAQIGQIISVIDDIAFQTNLLALNAGVEAARAGESGKGFAVVAQEVRELAGRSASAAKEIKALVDASSTQVGAGVSLVNRTGDALTTIDQQVQQVHKLIHAIEMSAAEQSGALAEVNEAVNRMDQVTQQNAAMAEEANAACRELNGEAENLGRMLVRFVLTGRSSARIHTPAPEYRQAS